MFWEAAAHWTGSVAESEGSIGLIPAYVGMVVGLVGLTLVDWQVGGLLPALLAGWGTAGTFVFWGNYPSYATAGGIGALALGMSMLFMPGWGRFVSALWIISGTLGIDELAPITRDWGPIGGFTVAGAAFAATGAFILWGLSRDVEDVTESSIRSAVHTS